MPNKETLESVYDIVDAIVPVDGNETDLKENTLCCLRAYLSYIYAMEAER